MPSAAELDRQHGLEGRLRFVDRAMGGIVAEIDTPFASAAVSLYGGQVLSYVRRGGRDLLWMSPFARLGTGKAVRGGIPVCWPWFGPHPDDKAMPAHGVLRTVDWSPAARSVAGDGAVRLVLEPGLPDAGAGAGAVTAALEITVGARLEVALVTRNGGDRPVTMTEALHTYLAVGDVARVQVEGLGECDYVDQLDDGAVRRQLGVVTVAGEVDRIYRTIGAPVTVIDPVLGHRIRVESVGSASTVVWNPWIDKSVRLGDVGMDGFRRFLCVETANAGLDPAVIAPHAEHRLGATYTVSPL